MLLKDLPPLKTIVTHHGLWTDKQLGQHFLFDFNLLDKIARAAGDISKHTVLEIGPGPGGLTRALLGCGANKVIAIEHDKRCLPVLNDIKACEDVGDRLQIIHADALTINERELISGPCKIVANLPYNIGTQLLLGWLNKRTLFDEMILMFQKEVAKRVVAKPGTKDYGRLAILSQYLCEASILFNVNPQAFVPPPKVMSSIVGLKPKQEMLTANTEQLEKITKAAFGQRRKVIRSALKPVSPDVDKWLERAGIDGSLRAENLSIEDYCRLASTL